MKKIFLLLLLAAASVVAMAKTIKTVGTTGADYATLKAAFDKINDATLVSPIELQIIDNTTEIATASLTKTGVTVAIYPTVSGKTISGELDASLITLGAGNNNIVSNVTIDGRVNQTGSTPDLTIENTSNGTSARTILFNNGSNGYVTNSKVTYCILKGSSQIAENSGGMIHINGGHLSQTNIEFSFNKITASGNVRPINAVWLGANTTGSRNVKIANNNFENVVKTNGIRLHNQAYSFEIAGNSFYETADFTPTTAYNFIQAGGSNTGGINGVISNNYMGGSSAQCAGMMATTGSFNQAFRPININNVQIKDGITISGNVIKNITWTNNSNAAFNGIYFQGHSTGNLPNTASNIAGNFISNVSIINSAGASEVFGINLNQKNVNIYNNIISLGTNHRANVYGIRLSISAYNALNIANVYYNTVYIQGEQPSSGNENSYALNVGSNTYTRDIRNNIFYNARTRLGGTGKHYAAYHNYNVMAVQPADPNPAISFTSDYNNYYVTGTGGVLGYAGADKSTLALFQAATGQDANSTDATPGITPGVTPESFKGTATLTAATGTGVTTDFTGNTRSASPLMGAFESSLWNGSEWVGGAPTSSTSALINGNFTTGGFNCLDLIVNPAKQVTITSESSVAGNLTLKSDATNGTATFIDNAALTVGADKTFVEQYLSNGRNWYISSPVSGATSNVFAASETNPMYYYVETTPNAWSSITNTTTNLDAKKGYIANINGDRVITFTGGGLNTGEQTIGSLTSGGATMTGFNLVGNPYPSYLSWNGASRTNVGTTIWYRSKSTGAYLFQTYNQAGGGSTNGGTNLIPPMQAFWVKVTAGQTGSIVFDVNDRTHNDQSVAANRLKAPAEDTRKWLRLEVSNGVNADETLIYADENAQNGFDTYDSNKLFSNSAAVPELYTVLGAEKLAINGFKDIVANQQLALGFKTSTANTFSIKATEVKNFEPGTTIILKDNTKPNEEFNLTAGDAYSFSSDIANNHIRFSLLFRAPGTISGVDTTEKLIAQVYVNAARQITIEAPENSSYAIYNAVGQLMTSGTLTGSILNSARFEAGVYVVNVSENGRNHTSRVIIQ